MMTKELIGKTITFADVDGSMVYLKFDDGSEFYYEATDGGYSGWEITKETDCDYERAVEQLEHDTLYEPTFNQDDGSM